jgi:hypothetical protein
MIDLTGISSERLMAWTRAVSRAPRLSGSPEERSAPRVRDGRVVSGRDRRLTALAGGRRPGARARARGGRLLLSCDS